MRCQPNGSTASLLCLNRPLLPSECITSECIKGSIASHSLQLLGGVHYVMRSGATPCNHGVIVTKLRQFLNVMFTRTSAPFM